MLQFKLKESVFKDWIIPNDKLIDEALRLDWGYSKLKKFIKSEIDQTEVYEVLLKHWRKIQETFTYLIAKSTYPSIGWLDFSSWANRIETVDNKHCKVSDIDRIFI